MESNNDQKLAARIGRLQLVSLIFKRLTLISVAAVVIGIISEMMYSPQALPIILSASAAIIVSLAAQKVFSGKIKKLTSGDFIVDILRETFQDCEYQYNVGVAGWRVEESQLVADWNEISGGDHVTGKYKGRLIEFSDIILKNAYETYNSDGARTTKRDLIFSGQWIVCELGCEIAEPVYL
jgi:hypothetical protein